MGLIFTDEKDEGRERTLQKRIERVVNVEANAVEDLKRFLVLSNAPPHASDLN
jgi:hypothetical protein